MDQEAHRHDLNRPLVACATALPAHTALLRLDGLGAQAVAAAAGLPVGAPRMARTAEWSLADGRCPVRVWHFSAPHSFTGNDLVEIALPGSPDLVAMALERLHGAGAAPAEPGAFARRAVANGRITLDRAEAVLAVATAGDAAQAQAAIGRLRGALAAELIPVRERLIGLRAQVEAVLDFAGEDGVADVDRAALGRELRSLRAVLARWQVAARHVGDDPLVALVGPANAGKSALFARLTGEAALVSPIAGTTRDVLDGVWKLAGRRVRLADTAGWLETLTALDQQAVSAGRAIAESAALILACSAPDAPLPADLAMSMERTLVLATKADLGVLEARAVLAVSVEHDSGIDLLAATVSERLGWGSAGEPRQARLLAEAEAILAALDHTWPGDELLADDLRRAADVLGELLGITTPDDVLDAIFSRFCIGK